MNAMTIEAQDAALAAIADDVHDELNPHLLIAKQQLDLAVPMIEALDGFDEQRQALLNYIERARQEMREAYAAMRRIVAGQTPDVLPILGLGAACEDLADRAKEMQIDVETFGLEHLNAVTKERQLPVYRLVQEALTNIAKHSGAKSAWVTVSPADEGLVVKIVDDGAGVDGLPERLERPMFMRSIKQRCAGLGARLDAVGKSERGGLSITIELPRDALT